jgi:hypothetical protein
MVVTIKGHADSKGIISSLRRHPLARQELAVREISPMRIINLELSLHLMCGFELPQPNLLDKERVLDWKPNFIPTLAFSFVTCFNESIIFLSL